MKVKYNFLKKVLLISVVFAGEFNIPDVSGKNSVSQYNTHNILEHKNISPVTAYHNAKVISIANPNSVVSGNRKSLIGSRTEIFTPEILRNGDIREIIVLSTPAGTPFSPYINFQI